jgi:hypothetical protein
MITPFIAAWRARHPEYASLIVFDSEIPFLSVYTPPRLPIASGNRGRNYVYVVDFASIINQDYITLAAITDKSDSKWRYKLNEEPWSPIIEGCSRVSVGSRPNGANARIRTGLNSLRVLEYDVESDFWPQLEDSQQIFFESDPTAVHDPNLYYARECFLSALSRAASENGTSAPPQSVLRLDCNVPITDPAGIPANTIVRIGCESDDWYETVPLNCNLAPLDTPNPLNFTSYPPMWPSI